MDNKKTNVLLIMSDDHGHWAMGCSGNKEIITPHLDRLAENGIRFENFFCTSPVCSPARASLFTGKIPSQHGVHDWIHKGHMSECEIDEKLKAKLYEENSGWEYDWPKKQIKQDVGVQYLKGHKLFTEILNEQGYECGLVGKWHLGDSGNPQGGFSYWRTMAMGGDNYYYPIVLEDGKFVMNKETYITDYITEEANKFISSERDKEKPFYLSVHYTAPHAPWNKEQHPSEVYKLYEECPFESVPCDVLHPWGDVKGKTDEEHRKLHREYLQGYYTAITAMDKSIGSLLDTLEQEGVLENTLIIFTGDNGMSMGHHGIYGKGNGTFPMNMYDT
ncbi:MAG: sulfatase-like hydrolase/transferase, partial [Cellulosilyticaceae bacterium]